MTRDDPLIPPTPSEEDYLRRPLQPHEGLTGARVPTVGFLGKIGEFKGTFDLIQAFGLLAREGLAFNVLALIGDEAGELLARHLSEAQLTDRTAVLPLAPHWRVPAFGYTSTCRHRFRSRRQGLQPCYPGAPPP